MTLVLSLGFVRAREESCAFLIQHTDRVHYSLLPYFERTEFFKHAHCDSRCTRDPRLAALPRGCTPARPAGDQSRDGELTRSPRFPRSR